MHSHVCSHAAHSHARPEAQSRESLPVWGNVYMFAMLSWQKTSGEKFNMCALQGSRLSPAGNGRM